MSDSTDLLIPHPARCISTGRMFECDGFTFINPDPRCRLYERLLEGDGCVPMAFADDPSLPAEGYRLDVNPSCTKLYSHDDGGLFNGLATLRQMTVLGQGTIDECIIEDRPRYGHRGMMLDCARHFFSVSYILRLLEALALYHINVFHWHLTDDQGWRLWIPSHPELVSVNPQQYYTESDVEAVVEKAGLFGIEVVPEIECPGHVGALLASHPELGCTGGPYVVEDRHGIFDDVLCMGQERIYDILEDVFRDVASMFPSRRIGIGGDECPVTRWKSCHRCRARMEEEGLEDEHDLQWLFTKRICAIVEKLGRTPVAWDDVAKPLSRGRDVDSSIQVLLWRDRDSAATILANGNPVMVCRYDDGAYLDYKQVDDEEEMGNLGVNTLEMSYSMRLDYSPLAGHGNVIGGQGNLWSEKILFPMQANYMLFPRLPALAEDFWCFDDAKDFDSFKHRLSGMKRILGTLGLDVDFRLE